MCVYVCMFVCVRACVRVCVYVSGVCVCMSVSVFVCACPRACLSVVSVAMDMASKRMLMSLQLVQQEEELRMEEEAYYEAKREAARIARLQKLREQNSRHTTSSVVLRNGPKSWLGEEETDWEV